MRDAVEIRHYLNRAGKDVFDDWLSRLADPRAQAKVAVRVNRVAAGNFGDCKPLGHGLWELRIDWRPGYRVLLCDAREVFCLDSFGRRQAEAVIGY